MSSLRSDMADFRRAYPNAVLTDQTTGETLPSLNSEIASETGEAKVEDEKRKGLVDPSVTLVAGKLIAVIPAITASEANEPSWVKTMQRKLSCKKAMRETLGPHHGLLTPFAEAYHAGKALRIVITRLGRRRLDKMANLGRSLKVPEDFLASAMLADDADPRWRCEAAQEPGGLIGVKIEVEIYS